MKRGKGEASKIGGAWVRRSLAMYQSPAWVALSGTDIRVLQRIEQEHMQHGGARNGRLLVTFNQFANYGIRRQSIGRSLHRLEALGFLEVQRHGYDVQAGAVRPNLYRLTYVDSRHDTHIGQFLRAKPVTDDWMKLDTPEKVVEALARAEEAARNARPLPDRHPTQNVDSSEQNAPSLSSAQNAPSAAA